MSAATVDLACGCRDSDGRFLANRSDYGDRIPGIWFYGATSRLHIRDGSTENGNDGCDPGEELELGVPTVVRLEIRATAVEVFINGESKCSSDRAQRTAHQGAHVYASDPWHPAAIATISNFYMVCDSDMDAEGLQAGGSTCASDGVKPSGGGH